MGHVTVRIHGKARNFLYCRPATWNTDHRTFRFDVHTNATVKESGKNIEPRPDPPPSCSWGHRRLHFDTALQWQHLRQQARSRAVLVYSVCVRVCGPVCKKTLPLQPQHWMKKLMRSSRGMSLSMAYASIQSSITICAEVEGCYIRTQLYSEQLYNEVLVLMYYY